MRKRTKQILSTLLAIVSLVTFAMPTVFASQGKEKGALEQTETPASLIVDFKTVFDNAGIPTDAYLQNYPAALDAAYETNKFTVYRGQDNNGKEKYPLTNTVYAGGRVRGEDKYLELAYNPSNHKQNIYEGFKFVAPGTGKYTLSFAYAKASVADPNGTEIGAYIVAMPETPYKQNTIPNPIETDLTKYLTKATLENPGSSGTVTADGTVALEEGKEYVIVFYVRDTTTPKVGAVANFVNFKLTPYVASTEPPADLTVNFATAFENAGVARGTYLQNAVSQLNAAYQMNKWTVYCGGTNDSVRPNNLYAGGRNREGYLEIKNNDIASYGATAVMPSQFVAPGTGEYRLSFDYGTVYSGDHKGAEMGAYILEMPETPFNKYGVPSPTNSNILTKAFVQNPGTSGNVTAENTVVLEEGTEYIIVFYVTSPDTNDAFADFKGFTLTFEKEVPEATEATTEATEATTPEETTPTEPLPSAAMSVNFRQDFANAGFSHGPYLQTDGSWRTINAGYPNTYKWAFYLDPTIGKDNSGKPVNTAYPTRIFSDSLLFQMRTYTAYTKEYTALKFTAPGTGYYSLGVTFSNSPSSHDANHFSAYILNVVDDPSVDTDGYTRYNISGACTDALLTVKEEFQGTYKGDVTASLTEGNEYILVFCISGDQEENYLELAGFSLYEEEEEVIPEPTEPEIPEGPGYTENVYDFFAGRQAGGTLKDGKDTINAWYEADELNWKFVASYGQDLSKVTYYSNVNSVRLLAGPTYWVAFKIKAPGADGSYNIQMTHAANGEGATLGNIYILPGDTAADNILKTATRKGPATTTDWFYGETTKDIIGGRQSSVGTVNMEAGKEYIVVFMSMEQSLLNKNGFMWLGQLEVTRVGDMVEENENGADDGSVLYEFYDWDHPGDYLNHYKKEEELKKQIVTQKIADEYANGTRNWCYQSSNGFASFTSGTPYLSITVGETFYYVLKIKSPGTGTYEITYDHYATAHAKAAPRGGVYIVPVEAGMDFATIRGEADFKDAIVTTTYKAAKTTAMQVTGTYTAFQEGKEYFICFSVEDDDNSAKESLNCYPKSLTMKRIGEYAPLAGEGAANGVAYNLTLKEFAGKRHDQNGIFNTIAQRYENGSMNWKLESGIGYAQFQAKYTQLATASDNKCWAIRIKSPGTGEYKITLDFIKGFEPQAANVGKIYVKEAPAETIGGSALNNHLVQQPIMEITYNCSGSRMQKGSANGTFMFQEGKEYIVVFQANDKSDPSNTTTTTYMYVDRLVMQRIGEYVGTEKVLNEGGIVAENVLTQFKTEAYVLTQINGHDYVAITLFGGTMLIYDLDEWRLVDEVKIGIANPHAMTEDKDGNWWITGSSQSLYCYNPYTREGFSTGKVSSGGQCLNIFSDPEESYVYYPVYSDDCVLLYRIHTETLQVTGWKMESWSRYSGPGGVVKGDYIYMTATGGARNEVWKVNKRTGTIVDRVDVTHRTKGERYIYNMSAMGDNHLLVYSDYGVTVVDTRDMSLLYDDAVGNLRGKTSRIASDPIDGKSYFVTNVEGLCYFDLETETFGVVGGNLVNYKTGLRFTNLATIEDSRLTEESMIAFGGMTADGLNIFAVNLETQNYIELIGLVEPSMGTGVNAHTLFKGEPGTNEIIYGPMYPDFPARVYNAATGELARTFWTKGQNDSYAWYNGKMYFGNYNGAILCEMNNGQPTQLFTLNDKNFDQSRVHGLCGGDNKVFIGTIPDNFVLGGVIAWYDLETELTYVVTGPNPEDVYYAKCSQRATTNEWYSVVTGELVTMADEWDYDNDGDGVYDHFKGPVPYQGIAKVCYSDGLLYGVSTLAGGSGAGEKSTGTSMIFIYDVENYKMLKTIDVSDYISGVPSRIRTIKSLEVDPDISNKLWGMISETLFSVIYDRDTNQVTIKEEISFNKVAVSASASVCTQMSFDGDYLYALFGPIGGLLKINRKDTSDYTKVMGDFDLVSQVPSSFILGDDGDIYYISTQSPHIYVLNTEITDEERASAKAVQDTIDLIPEDITLADRGTIEAARAAWDAMPKANQPLVNNLDKLENAEIALLVLRIDALSDNITIEDEQELMAIRAEYMALDIEQRMKIDFYKVSQAESKMSILRGERTTNMINSIGEVTLAKEQLIRDARASFMALSRYERMLVQNIDVLNAAEAVLTGLLLQKSEAGAVDKLVEKIGFVFFGDGAKISAARKAYNKLDDATKEMVEKYSILVISEIIIVVEYLIAAAAVTGGVLYAIPATRTKIFKKKVKAE